MNAYRSPPPKTLFCVVTVYWESRDGGINPVLTHRFVWAVSAKEHVRRKIEAIGGRQQAHLVLTAQDFHTRATRRGVPLRSVP